MINEDDDTGVSVHYYTVLSQITQETQLEDSPVAQENALEITLRSPKSMKRNILS